MNAAITYEPGREAWRATRRASDSGQAFRRARRHSRLVRLLRVGIPFSVVLTIVGYGLAGLLNPLQNLNLPAMKLGISGTKLTMDTPKLAGFTRDGRPYEVTASSAAQDLKQPQFIELKDVRAKLTLEDGMTVDITADAGLYNTKTEVMILRQNVLVDASDGSQMRLAEATLDARKGHVVSEKPVEILMPTGRVDAQQMEVLESGAVVHLRGGVRMTLKGDAAAAPAPASAEQRR
jgi:lipopolysaccharide export system protein LptC